MDTNQCANTNGLLSKKQAAELLKVHPRTVDHWMAKKIIPYIKVPAGKGGRAGVVRFSLNDLEAFLNSHRVACVERRKMVW